MTNMFSKSRYMYDAAPSVSLLGQFDAAHTATFIGTAHVLDTLDGYWNAAGDSADQAFAIVIQVADVETSVSSVKTSHGTLTLNTVVSTNVVTIHDGVKTKTYTAGTDYVVGGSDTVTATNLAAAINAAHTATTQDATATSAGAVVTVLALHPTGASFTGASGTITGTAFTPSAATGGDETYNLTVEVGPIGFGSATVVGGVPVIRSPGQYVVLLDMQTVKLSNPDAAAVRIKGLVAGTAPSITAFAWIAPLCP